MKLTKALTCAALIATLSITAAQAEKETCGPGWGYIGDSTCKTCPAGYYHHKKTDGESCAQCPEGYYASKQAATGCMLCPQDNYCPARSTKPTKCSVGTYTKGDYTVGARSADDCYSCAEDINDINIYKCPSANCSGCKSWAI